MTWQELRTVWHLDLAMVGLVGGAAMQVFAWFVQRRTARGAVPGCLLSLVLAVAVLEAEGLSSLAVIAGAVVLLASGVSAGTPAVVLAAAGAALLGTSFSDEPVALATFVAPASFWISARLRRWLPPPGIAGLGVMTILGAAYLCAPDTEEVIIVGCTSLAPALVSWLRSLRGAPDDSSSWLPLILVAGWATTRGFRGRPEGLPALWVAQAAVAAAVLAVAWLGVDVERRRSAIWTIPLLGAAAAAAIAARTIGLSSDLPSGLLPAVAATCGLLGWWCAWVRWVQRPRFAT